MSPSQAAMAKRMINASLCAYSIHPAGWTPDPTEILPLIERIIQGKAGKSFYDVVPLYQDAVGFTGTAANEYAPLFATSGIDQINAALVGAMTDTNVVVAIRGTLEPDLRNKDIWAMLHDWINDADIAPRSWTIAGTSFTTKTKAEAGFAKAMISLWPSISAMISKTITPTTKGIIVTGHSKGAALAFLAATLIEAHFPQFAGKTEVHAFAAPVTGDASFAAAYTPFASRTHRYQVEFDVVPFLPLWAGNDIFAKTAERTLLPRIFWDGLSLAARHITKGGYSAVGDFTYFNSQHLIVPGADVHRTALPSLAALLAKGDVAAIAKVGAAHSAVTSYLPCFA